MTSSDHNTKVAMVLDASMPAGLAANTAAVLTLTLGRQVESLVGPELRMQTAVGIQGSPLSRYPS